MPNSLVALTSLATRGSLGELIPDFARRQGRAVELVACPGVEAAQRVQAGEAFDVVVLSQPVLEALEAEGRLAPGTTIAPYARSPMAAAVRAGAPRPDISDARAVQAAILAARRLAYSTGPSGGHLLNQLRAWGLYETMATRLIQARPGEPVGQLVAEGRAELGIQQLSELQHVPGIDILGLLPDDAQTITLFSAALGAACACRTEAEALIAFLTSPEASEAKRRDGMEPC